MLIPRAAIKMDFHLSSVNALLSHPMATSFQQVSENGGPTPLRIDGKPITGVGPDILSPLSPFSPITEDTLSPLSPLGDNQLLDATDKVEEPITQSKSEKTAAAFKLSSACIDEDRPMRIVVIGAGFTGITAGIRYVSAL